MDELEKKLFLAIWATEEGFECHPTYEGQQKLLDDPLPTHLLASKLRVTDEELWLALRGLIGEGLVANENPEEIADRYVSFDTAILEDRFYDALEGEAIDEDDYREVGASYIYHITHKGFSEIVRNFVEYHQLSSSDELQAFFLEARLTNPFTRDYDINERQYMNDFLEQREVVNALEEVHNRLNEVPGSDRSVPLNHNSPEYQRTQSGLNQLIELVRGDNSLANEDVESREKILGELKATQELLKAERVAPNTVKNLAGPALAYLAGKFADAPIGELAQHVWEAIKLLLGIG